VAKKSHVQTKIARLVPVRMFMIAQFSCL